MTDYLNPNRIYPYCPSRRIDNPPGFDSIRQGRGMNRQEAAEVLTALKQSLEMSDDYDYCYYSRDIDAYDTALTALRGPQPDPITGLMPCGCEWCMAEKRIMEHHGLSFNAYCVIFDGKLDVSYDNNDINEWVCGHKEVKINYCPMCGRKLEGRQ